MIKGRLKKILASSLILLTIVALNPVFSFSPDSILQFGSRVYAEGVDTYTKSLLHMDGADESTTFTDETVKTWTTYGNTQIDTAQSKFGGASGLFDGTGDYIDTPDSEDFNIGSGDFTIDFWIKRNSTGAFQFICGQSDQTSSATSRSADMLFTNTNNVRLAFASGSTLYFCDSSGTITDSNWHHIAAVRDGNTLRIFIDGTQQGTCDVTGLTANNSGNKFSIGRRGEYNSFYFNGWIDEFRFSNGIARWTSNFTPPSSPYGNNLPEVTINNPTDTVTYKRTDTNVVPEILVSDSDNDDLTCKYYIDSETNPRDTILVTGTTTPQAVTFQGIDMSQLSEGGHTVTFEVDDGTDVVTEYVNISVTHAFPEPENVTASPLGTSITVSWQGHTGDYGYDIEVDGQIIDNGISTSYTHTGLMKGTQHTYRVRAKNQTEVSAWSDYLTASTLSSVPSGPLNIDAYPHDNFIVLVWNEVTDAWKYIVTFDGNEVYNGTSNTFLQFGLTPDTTYAIRVKAVNDIGEGPYTDINVTTYLLPTPYVSELIETEDTVSLSWDTVAGIGWYEIDVDSNVINNGTSTSYEHIGLTQDTEHTYSVRAVNSQGESAWSDMISARTLPEIPDIPSSLRAMASSNKIKLTWDEVIGEIEYEVELDGVMIENGESTAYIHNGLEPYTLHTYRIRSRNNSIESQWSDEITVRTLPGRPMPPEGIAVETIGSTVKLMWDEELGAKEYYVEADGIERSTGSRTEFIHRNAPRDEEHVYRIKTRNITGTGEWGGYIVSNSLRAICTREEDLDLGLTASDITDFSKYTLNVTYNPDVIDVLDLCDLTTEAELSEGQIEGTDITITYFEPGRITFVVDKPIEIGTSWSGVINSIKFNAKVSGGTSITYMVLCEP